MLHNTKMIGENKVLHHTNTIGNTTGMIASRSTRKNCKEPWSGVSASCPCLNLWQSQECDRQVLYCTEEARCSLYVNA